MHAIVLIIDLVLTYNIETQFQRKVHFVMIFVYIDRTKISPDFRYCEGFVSQNNAHFHFT